MQYHRPKPPSTDKASVTMKLSLAKIRYDDVLFLPCKIPTIVAKAMVTPIGKMATKKKMLLHTPAAAS